MKFAIVAIVLLATVTEIYSQEAVSAGPKNLPPQDIKEISKILTRIVGPKLSATLTSLIVSLANGVLNKVPLRGVVHSVAGLVIKLLKSHGILEKILGGGNPNAAKGGANGANGQPKNLTPEDQERLIKILNRTVGPYTSRYIVKTVALLLDGLLGKIPLHALIHSLTGLVGEVFKPNALVGQLLGRGGLGKPISELLGARS